MKKIIFLCDSITDASHCFLENPLGNGYVNMVAEKLNDSDGGRKKYDIMNRGSDGFTIHKSLYCQNKGIGFTCVEKIVFKNGIPQTTKKGKRFHGFGMKSI